MGKNMYSLMLSKSIMQEIDKIAYRTGTNRSNLINRILAEYISYETPEMKIKEIFNRISNLINNSDFVLLSEGNSSLSIKSPLEYKYRPTIKYFLEMDKTNENTQIGTLKVSFRTQSSDLLEILDSFFNLFVLLEKKYIHPLFEPGTISYKIEPGKFQRSFPMPKTEDENKNKVIGEAVISYIKIFDKLLKWFLLNPDTNVAHIEKQYLLLIENKIII